MNTAITLGNIILSRRSHSQCEMPLAVNGQEPLSILNGNIVANVYRPHLRRSTRPRDLRHVYFSRHLTIHYSDSIDSVGSTNEEEVFRTEDPSRNRSVSCPTTWFKNLNSKATSRIANFRQRFRSNDSEIIDQGLVSCRAGPFSFDMHCRERLGLWRSKSFGVQPATAA